MTTATHTRLEDLAQQRAGRKQEVFRGLRDWMQTAIESVTALADEMGAVGSDRLVVCYGRTAVAPLDGECPDCGGPTGEIHEALKSVTVAAAGRAVTLSPGGNDSALWAMAVEIWDDLRDAVGAAFRTEVPVGLVVDIDRSAVAFFDEIYCPYRDVIEPVLVVHLDTLADGSAPSDPFDELLSFADRDEQANELADEWAERFVDLVTEYGLALPSEPHNPDVDCDECVDEFDPEDDPQNDPEDDFDPEDDPEGGER